MFLQYVICNLHMTWGSLNYEWLCLTWMTKVFSSSLDTLFVSSGPLMIISNGMLYSLFSNFSMSFMESDMGSKKLSKRVRKMLFRTLFGGFASLNVVQGCVMCWSTLSTIRYLKRKLLLFNIFLFFLVQSWVTCWSIRSTILSLSLKEIDRNILGFFLDLVLTFLPVLWLFLMCWDTTNFIESF